MTISDLILGIDSGLTVTKAVVFTAAGEVVSAGSCEIEQLKPRSRFVERDMAGHWEGTKKAISQALSDDAVDGRRIGAIGVTGHGDGLYLLDASERPFRNAILSLDSRGCDMVEAWRKSGILDEALPLTGQYPYPAAPSALLAWLKKHAPDDFLKIRWVLFCKDWIRYKLTGKIATDFTEASVSFANVQTQSYDHRVLKLFDLQEVADWLPEVVSPLGVAGEVHQAAAKETGLPEGTPVVAGLHDVTASALGMGSARPGHLSIIAGTFSINEVISNRPKTDPAWFCRNGLQSGEWMNMSISPASSANIDWFIKTNYRDLLALARQRGESIYDDLEADLSAAFSDDSRIVYHPFLYGSPHGDMATAAFLGVQAWHGRGHLLRAVIEGVVFNHRYHVEALRSAFPCRSARPEWRQFQESAGLSAIRGCDGTPHGSGGCPGNRRIGRGHVRRRGNIAFRLSFGGRG